VLGAPPLLDAARALVPPAAAAARSGLACADVPFGSAGLLLNILQLHAAAPDGELDELVRDLAAATLTALEDPAARFAPYAPTSRIADFVPTGRDSIALALARTLEAAPELVDGPMPSHRYDLTRRGGRLAAGVAAAPASDSCRELVAAANEALFAGDTEAAERLARTLAGRRDRTGRWFSDRWVDDRLNLSAVDGLVAVGMLMLGLVDTDLAPLTVLR
jgi:hypothetical protein